jgi:hypothetical protein
MRASSYSRLVFRRLTSAIVSMLSVMLLLSTAKADIILGDPSHIQLDFATIGPIRELKIDNPKSKQALKNTYTRFVQESVDHGAVFLSVLNTPGKDEKSVAHVQAKHFRYYVMPSIRETPSEMERIALSHQASGTQSRMLVMTK